MGLDLNWGAEGTIPHDLDKFELLFCNDGLVAVVSLTSLSLGFLTSVTGILELLYKANTRIKGDFIYLH